LVRAWIDDPSGNFSAPASSWPGYEHYRDNASSFQPLSAPTFHPSSLTAAGDAEHLNGLSVTSNLLTVHGLRVSRGRDFNAVINESFARKLFPGESAIGRTILTGMDGEVVNEIVGVIAAVKSTALNQPAPDEIDYCGNQRAINGMALAARTSLAPSTLQPAIATQSPQSIPPSQFSFSAPWTKSRSIPAVSRASPPRSWSASPASCSRWEWWVCIPSWPAA